MDDHESLRNSYWGFESLRTRVSTKKAITVDLDEFEVGYLQSLLRGDARKRGRNRAKLPGIFGDAADPTSQNNKLTLALRLYRKLGGDIAGIDNLNVPTDEREALANAELIHDNPRLQQKQTEHG